MVDPNTYIGLPWQLVEPKLQAASVPYDCTMGKSFAKRFTVEKGNPYVARIQVKEGHWSILLYEPMRRSDFCLAREVHYAQ